MQVTFLTGVKYPHPYESDVRIYALYGPFNHIGVATFDPRGTKQRKRRAKNIKKG